MTEGAEELSPQELRQQELAELRKYAQEQAENGFVWVYRGEGEADQSLAGAHKPEQVGTWFTTNFAIAQDHASKVEKRGSKGMRIVAVAIPKSMLDVDEQIRRRGGRMPIGTDTVLVPFRDDLIVKETGTPILEVPTPDIYVSQFKIAQEVTPVVDKSTE